MYAAEHARSGFRWEDNKLVPAKMGYLLRFTGPKVSGSRGPEGGS